MILGLPTSDPDVEARREALLHQRETVGAELAYVELRLAAHILWNLYGNDAVQLLVDKYTNSHGETEITPLVLLDSNDQPLWFSSALPGDIPYDSSEYPGAAAVADDHGHPAREMDEATQEALVGHLTAAYDAVGGASGALSPAPDDFYGGLNVLALNVHAAFDPHTPAPGPAAARRLLGMRLPDNDADAATVRDYLTALLTTLWREEGDFYGKAPFGNSGWQYDIYLPMIRAGLVPGSVDDDGYVNDDFVAVDADTLILAAIAELGS